MAVDILLKGRDGERGHAKWAWPAQNLGGRVQGLRRWGGEEWSKEEAKHLKSVLEMMVGRWGGGVTMAWRISSSQKITGDGWRAQGAERAGEEVAASKLAEPCEQGTGGRDHSQCDGRPRVPRTQAEVGNVCRGPGLRGTRAEGREQTQ